MQPMRDFSAQDLRDDSVLNASEGYMQPMRDYNASDLENDPLLKAAPGYFKPLGRFGQADLDGDLVYQNGLQFGLNEGRRGIENMGAATGSALSGNTLRALTRFGNDFATQRTGDAYNRFNTEQNTRQQQKEGSSNRFNANQNYKYGLRTGSSNRFNANQNYKYGLRTDSSNRFNANQNYKYGLRTDSSNRFQTNQNYKYGLRTDSSNRFNANRDSQFNKLSALSGTGQVASGAMGTAGQNYANNISQTAMGLGNAQGASAIAQGNALSGGINNAIGGYQQSRLLQAYQDRIARGGSSIGGGGSSMGSEPYPGYFESIGGR